MDFFNRSIFSNTSSTYSSRFLLVIVLAAFLGSTTVYAAKLPALKVKGTRLVNEKGKTVQLKGVSTHGLSWYPEYVNQKAFTHMKKKWGINVVRLAMYTSEYNGYCTGDDANRKALEKKIDQGVTYATKAGMYVIIDWHILSDGECCAAASTSWDQVGVPIKITAFLSLERMAFTTLFA